MIAELPILPSSFNEWNWAKSNGNASNSQTQKAYTAITTQGLCSDFSRNVWNDLVSLLYRVLQQAGVEWDSTYGSYSSCVMTAATDTLTADKFNAVALNIHQFGFVTWQWAVNNSLDGYVGRDQFYGYSTLKDKADNVYGWYFLHLTQRLNKLIEVLKDEADFSEFETLCQSQSLSLAPLSIVGVKSLLFNGSGMFSITAPLATTPTQTMSVALSGYSYQNGIIVPVPVLEIAGKRKSISKTVAISDRVKTVAISQNVSSESIARAELLDMVFVGFMRYAKAAESKVSADIEINNVVYNEAVSKALSIACTALYGATANPIKAMGQISSLTNTALLLAHPLLLLTGDYSSDQVSGILSLIEPRTLITANKEASYVNSTLRSAGIRSLERKERIFDYPLAEIDVVGINPLLFTMTPQSAIASDISLLHSTNIRARACSFTDIISEAESIRPKFADAITRLFTNQISTIIVAPSGVRIASICKTDSLYIADVDKGMSNPIVAVCLSEDHLRGLLTSGKTEYFVRLVTSSFNYTSDAVAKMSKPLVSVSGSYARHIAFSVACHSANMVRLSQIFVNDKGTMFVAKAAYGGMKISAQSGQKSQANAVRGVFLTEQLKSDSVENSEIQVCLPSFVRSISFSSDNILGAVNTQNGKPLGGARKSSTATSAIVTINERQNLESICKSFTKAQCSLELERIKSEWLYPIQNDDDLYIQQALETNAQGDTLEVI